MRALEHPSSTRGGVCHSHRAPPSMAVTSTSLRCEITSSRRRRASLLEAAAAANSWSDPPTRGRSRLSTTTIALVLHVMSLSRAGSYYSITHLWGPCALDALAGTGAVDLPSTSVVNLKSKGPRGIHTSHSRHTTCTQSTWQMSHVASDSVRPMVKRVGISGPNVESVSSQVGGNTGGRASWFGTGAVANLRGFLCRPI